MSNPNAYITLIFANNPKYNIKMSKNAAKMSELLCCIIDSDPDIKTVNMSEHVDMHSVQHIVDFCEYFCEKHNQLKKLKELKPPIHSNSLKELVGDRVAQYVECIKFGKPLLNTYTIANYLGVTLYFKLIALHFGCHLKNRSEKYIRKKFKIKNWNTYSESERNAVRLLYQ